MASGSNTGVSLIDAIDLDGISDGENNPPSSSGGGGLDDSQGIVLTRFIAPKESAIRASRSGDSDSPPPIITGTNLNQSGGSSSRHSKQTARRARPFVGTTSTRQRLMDAVRSPNEDEEEEEYFDPDDLMAWVPSNRSSTASFMKAAPQSARPSFASNESSSRVDLSSYRPRTNLTSEYTSAELLSRLNGTSQVPQTSAPTTTITSTPQIKSEPKMSNVSNAGSVQTSSSSRQQPHRAGYDMVLRQVITYRVDPTESSNLQHGKVLEPLAMVTVEDEGKDFWKIDLIDSTTNRYAGVWNGKIADETYNIVKKYHLKLVFRHLNPAALFHSTLSTQSGSSKFAVMEIQCPRLGDFALYILPYLKNKMKMKLCILNSVFKPTAVMPTRVTAEMHNLLPEFVSHFKEFEQKHPVLPRLTTVTSNMTPGASSSSSTAPANPAAVPSASPSAISHLTGMKDQALRYVANQVNAYGLNMPSLIGSAGVTSSPSTTNADAMTSQRAWEIATGAIRGRTIPPQVPFPQVAPPPYSSTMPGSIFPGTYPDLYRYGSRVDTNDPDILQDRDMLMAALDDEDDDEDYMPIDDEMQGILNNMADGTFHGTDALATLYGDKGVDVAKLPLYSELEELKKRGLKTDLHSHQLQGLLWMIKAEHRRVSTTPGTTRGLWVTRRDRGGRYYYFNLATRKCRRKAPVLPRGGINSDSMGLGKTIQIIATCLADRNRVPKGIKPVYGEDNNNDVKPEIKGEDKGEGGSKSVAKIEEIKGEADKAIDVDVDSEEDYTSDTESDCGKGGSDDDDESTVDSDTSITESETDEDMPKAKKVKTEEEPHRPTDSEGKMIKNEDTDSETEDEDEKPRRSAERAKKNRKSKEQAIKKKAADKKRKRAAEKKKKAEKVKKEKKENEIKEEKKVEEVEKVIYNETTLVICPLSVLQNWTGQVDQHCDRKKVSYFVHHGDAAKNLRKKLQFDEYFGKHTFVFTTYDTVRMEYRVIQKRRQAKMEADRKEAEKQRLALEKESGAPSAGLLPFLDRNGGSKPREGTTSLEETEVSDFKADSDVEEIKPGTSKKKNTKKKTKGKGKGKSKGKGKGKTDGKWYGSDDSMMGSDDDIDDDEEDDMYYEISDDPREIPLFGVNWRRIVLDEAHICRNPRTNLYNAICELIGERRWAITGTPIVNSTKDLGALAAWCGLEPFSHDLKEWSKLIEKPLKRSGTSERAAGLLRSVVTSICLRRHKSMKNAEGQPIVKLPDVKFYKHTIPLTTSDRDYYTRCEAACREHLARWVSDGSVNEHRSAILVFLLRLRQMSCHRRLIGSQLLEEIQNRNWDTMDQAQPVVNLDKAAVKELQDKLKVHVEMNDDCPICLEALLGREPMITPCGHPFCKACLTSLVCGSLSGPPKCPMDRQVLPKMESMIEMPPEREESTEVEEEYEYEEDANSERTSAKVSEVLKLIRATLARDPTEKILIFSNFVKFLNIFGEELREANIAHARFNGELNVKRRDTVLHSFGRPINPRQAKVIQSNIAHLERKYQRERAAQKQATEEEEGAAPSSDASQKKAPSSTSSAILNSLRDMDYELPKLQTPKSRGKQRAQELDIIGDNPSILLISMGCGALGLNLTAASTVILCDPWWQSSAEQQAIDRTHRIGQTRDIKVFQIICENTVEARVLEIQAIKEGLTETAFSGMRAQGSATDKRQKIESNWKDLGRLFGMDQRQIDILSRQAAAHANANANANGIHRR